MGRIDTKAKHRRPVSETALPSRGQRKRALKKASLIKKISLTERVQRGTGEPKDGEHAATESLLPGSVAGESVLTSTIATGTKLKCPKRIAFQRVISNKGKRTLMAAEMGQVNAVLAADSFQQDPFLAIQAHLRQKAQAAPPVVDNKAENTKNKAKTSREARESKRVGKHAQEARGDRGQTAKAKPYKGRNAKMRVKR